MTYRERLRWEATDSVDRFGRNWDTRDPIQSGCKRLDRSFAQSKLKRPDCFVMQTFICARGARGERALPDP